MDNKTINHSVSIEQIEEPKDIQDVIANLMVNPNLDPVNYFNDFGIDELTNRGGYDDTGIFVDDKGTFVSMTTHAYHHRLNEDPSLASEILISRAFRRMVCFGAKPQALSAFLYHLDVNDPNGKFIATEAKKGIDNAARTFKVKVADRKIRFDHSHDSSKMAPTLIVTVIGSLEDKSKMLTHHFKSKGNNLFVIGEFHNDINASEYLHFHHRVKDSSFPIFDLNVEAKLHNIIKDLREEDLISSASPVGRGGLFFSLLRAAIPAKLGFDITTDAEIRTDAFLFGESMGRILVGVEDHKVDDFIDLVSNSGLPLLTLGHTTNGEMRIDDDSCGFIDKY